MSNAKNENGTKGKAGQKNEIMQNFNFMSVKKLFTAQIIRVVFTTIEFLAFENCALEFESLSH